MGQNQLTESQRDKNRQAAPNVADIVDKFEAVFGKVKVTAAEDYITGVKFGKFPINLAEDYDVRE